MKLSNRTYADTLVNILCYIGLSGILFSFGVLQYVWLRLDHMPPIGDGLPYMLRGMRFFYLFSDTHVLSWIVELLRYDFVSPYPPIGEFFYFLYYLIFGVSSEMDFMVNVLFFGVGLLGVYGIGKELCNKRAGLLAAFFFASLPGILFYSKMGMREFPLTCFLAPTYFFLLKTKNFTNTKYSIYFGIMAAITFLFKYEILVFIFLPVVVTFIGVINELRSKRFSFGDIANNLCYVIFVFVLAACPWYVINHKEFLTVTMERITGRHESVISFSLHDTVYYVQSCYSQIMTLTQAGSVAILAVLIAVQKYIFKMLCGAVGPIIRLFFYIVVPVVAFGFIGPKDASHILPVAIFCAPLLAVLCCTLAFSLLRCFFILVLCVNGINAQYIQFSALWHKTGGVPLSVRMHKLDHYFYTKHLFDHRLKPFGLYHLLCGDRWDSILSDIVFFVDDDWAASRVDKEYDQKPRLLFLINNEPMRFHQLQYYNLKAGNRINIVSPIFTDYLIGAFHSEGEATFREIVFEEEYDYIIIESPTIFKHGEEDARIKSALSYLEENEYSFKNTYKEVKDISLPRPKWAKAVVYKNARRIISAKPVLAQEGIEGAA